MAFDLVISPPTFTLSSVKGYETQWSRIRNPLVRTVIAREHQYFDFHEALLAGMHFTKDGCAANPPYTRRLDYTLRAGFVKAAMLVAASICEAALREHGERRGLSLANDPRRRTFGNILTAWRHEADVAHIYTDLTNLKDMRNNVHLFVAAGNANANYQQVIAQESTMLTQAKTSIQVVMSLTSP